MSGPVKLPRVSLAGRLYYQDNRLREFRAVHNPFDVLGFDMVAPDDPLLLGEVVRSTEDSTEVVALRGKLDQAEWALVAFGIEMSDRFGVCPEFEDDDSAINNADAQALHDRFWALQATARGILEQLDAAAEHDAENERCV